MCKSAKMIRLPEDVSMTIQCGQYGTDHAVHSNIIAGVAVFSWDATPVFVIRVREAEEGGYLYRIDDNDVWNWGPSIDHAMRVTDTEKAIDLTRKAPTGVDAVRIAWE